jgi:hypothetical protein
MAHFNVRGIVLCGDCNTTGKPHPFYCTTCGRPLFTVDDIDARECVQCQCWSAEIDLKHWQAGARA